MVIWCGRGIYPTPPDFQVLLVEELEYSCYNTQLVHKHHGHFSFAEATSVPWRTVPAWDARVVRGRPRVEVSKSRKRQQATLPLEPQYHHRSSPRILIYFDRTAPVSGLDIENTARHQTCKLEWLDLSISFAGSWRTPLDVSGSSATIPLEHGPVL